MSSEDSMSSEVLISSMNVLLKAEKEKVLQRFPGISNTVIKKKNKKKKQNM